MIYITDFHIIKLFFCMMEKAILTVFNKNETMRQFQ